MAKYPISTGMVAGNAAARALRSITGGHFLALFDVVSYFTHFIVEKQGGRKNFPSVHKRSVVFPPIICIIMSYWKSWRGAFLLFLAGCFFLVTLVVFVFWSRLRRPTFQRRKVGKVRRACGPGPGVGGRRWGLRGLQALWLLPAVLASALNTSAIGPSGGYPPCKTCEQLPCLWLYSCRLSDYQPLQDSLGVESAGVFFLAFRFARQRGYLQEANSYRFLSAPTQHKSIQ